MKNPANTSLDTATLDGLLRPISWVAENLTIQELKTLYDEGRLNLSPLYARGSAWREKQKTNLILNLLGGWPIDNITLNKQGNDYDIVNGKQRLLAIFDFLDDEFRTKGLKFSELPADFQQRFVSTPLDIVVYNDLPMRRAAKLFLIFNNAY